MLSAKLPQNDHRSRPAKSARWQRMSRMLCCLAGVTLFAMTAMGIGAAQAHQMLYDQDGYRLAVGIEAGLGGFAVGNADTGAGNVNTDAPLGEPFPSSERRVTRD